MQVARSTSRPSCVSFSEMLRPMPACSIAATASRYAACRRRGLVRRGHALAEQIERHGQALLFDMRAASIASATLSPAMNRRAKLPAGACRTARRGVSGGGCWRGAKTRPSATRLDGSMRRPCVARRRRAGARSCARSSAARCRSRTRSVWPSSTRTSRATRRADAFVARPAARCGPTRLAPASASLPTRSSRRRLQLRAGHVRPHHRRDQRRRQHLVAAPDRVLHLMRQRHEIAARVGIERAERNGRRERDERARFVADGVPRHFGDFLREQPLALPAGLARNDALFEHQVVGDGHRHDRELARDRPEAPPAAGRSSASSARRV